MRKILLSVLLTIGILSTQAQGGGTTVDGIVAGTSHQTGYPSDVGDPIFWLDCANTNGWTFNASGEASMIPSRTGDRYLSLTAGDVTGVFIHHRA